MLDLDAAQPKRSSTCTILRTQGHKQLLTRSLKVVFLNRVPEEFWNSYLGAATGG